MDADLVLLEGEELGQECDLGNQRYLDWHGLACNTDLLPFLLERVVHPAPAEQQFGYLLGIYRWAHKRGMASLSLTVMAPRPGQKEVLHGGLLWPRASSLGGLHRLCTKDLPDNAVLDIWKFNTQQGWRRMVQPERVRFTVSNQCIPEDAEKQLDLYFGQWLSAEHAPVFVVDFRSTDPLTGKIKTAKLDFSGWLSRLPAVDRDCVIAEAYQDFSGRLRDAVANRPDLDGQLAPSTRPQFSPPAPRRIAARQAAQLQATTLATHRPAPRRL